MAKKEKQLSNYIYFPENKYGKIALNHATLPYALYLSVIDVDGVDTSKWNGDLNQLHKLANKKLNCVIKDGEMYVSTTISISRGSKATEVVNEVQRTIKEQLQYIFDIVVGRIDVEIENIAV